MDMDPSKIATKPAVSSAARVGSTSGSRRSGSAVGHGMGFKKQASYRKLDRANSNFNIAVNYRDFASVEKTMFDDVKIALLTHRRYLLSGVVPFQDLLDTLDRYRTFGFRPSSGSVIESLDPSMNWKTCVVTHTYIEMDETTDIDEGVDKIVMATVTQDSGIRDSLSQGNDPEEVRPPRAAVEAVFGQTPLFWSQHQLLLAEDMMIFERFHCFDFEQIDWNKWISERFYFWAGQSRIDDSDTRWVDSDEKDPSNGPFQQLFAQQSNGAKDALFEIVKEPWEVMDKILHSWFDDYSKSVSCYTYLSFLGQDWFFPLLAAALQFTIPVILLVSGYTSFSKRVSKHCDHTMDGDACVAMHPDATSMVCVQRLNDDAFMGRALILCIMLYYFAKNVPDQMALFYATVGDSESTTSKLVME